MPKYPVKGPLKYNGDDYAEGDTVEMSAKEAKELVAIDVLGEAAKEAAGGKGKPGGQAE